MDKSLSPLPALLCLIVAFLSVCLAWLSTEYLNLETKSQVALIRLEGRIKELEAKADSIIFKLDDAHGPTKLVPNRNDGTTPK